MKNTAIVLLSLTIAGAALPAAASRALPQFRVDALEEKKDVTIKIDTGALAAIGGGHDINGILADTTYFKGQKLKAYVIFADSVPNDTIDDLSAYQGKLSGTLQCKRIRVGSSPDVPGVKTAVLAENCTIKALNQ